VTPQRWPSGWGQPGRLSAKTGPTYQQAWDVENLFVMDGAGFVSSACQDSTLTIVALAVRSTHYLLGELKRGHV
jgi:choline dehydrogenase-like flavoprotein